MNIFAVFGISTTLTTTFLLLTKKKKDNDKFMAFNPPSNEFQSPNLDDSILKGSSDFYFSNKGKFIGAKLNNLTKDRFFVSDLSQNAHSEIKFDDDIFRLARIIYAEAGGTNLIEKIGIAEVVRNRVDDNTPNAEKYCWNRYFDKYKTYKDVIEKTGFDGTKGGRYINPFNYLQYPVEKKAFIECILAASIAMFQKSNLWEGALYFNLDKKNPCSKSFYQVTAHDNKGFKVYHGFFAPTNS